MDWLDDASMISEIKELSKELQSRELSVDLNDKINVCNASEPTVKSNYHSEIKNGEKEVEIDGKKYRQKYQRHIQLEKHTVKQIFTFTGKEDSILDIDINPATCSDSSHNENDVFYNLNSKNITEDTKRILSPKVIIRSSNSQSPTIEKTLPNSNPSNCFCKSKNESEIVSFINKYGSTDLSELVMDKKISNDLRDSFLSQWQKIETHTRPNVKSKTISCVERFNAISPKGKILHQSTCVQMTRSLLIRSRSIDNKTGREEDREVFKREVQKIETPLLYKIDVSKFLVYNEKYNQSLDNVCKYLSITAGNVDALITHACSIGVNSLDDYPLFHKVFVVTHSLFIPVEDLIEKLIMRYKYFSQESNINLDDLKDIDFSSENIQEEILMAIINVIVGVINYWSRLSLSNVQQTLKSFCEYLNKNGSIKKELLIQSALRDLHNRIQIKNKRATLIKDLLTLHLTNSSNVSGACSKSIMDFDSHEVAEQITLLESRVFDEVELEDLLSFKSADKNEALMNCVHFFNNLTFWVKTQLFVENEKVYIDRERKIVKFLDILKALKAHQNYSSYTSILYSLIDFPEKFLSKRLKQKLTEECQFISLSNKRQYHDAIQSAQPPFIPLLAETFSHLTRLNEIMPTFLGSTDNNAQVLTVNFRKMWQYFIVLQYFVVKLHTPPEKKYYQLKPNVEVLRFINDFKDALTEAELYQCRDILVRSKTKKLQPQQSSEKES